MLEKLENKTVTKVDDREKSVDSGVRTRRKITSFYCFTILPGFLDKCRMVLKYEIYVSFGVEDVNRWFWLGKSQSTPLGVGTGICISVGKVR